MFRRTLAPAVAIATLAACSGLPDYAKPQVAVMEAERYSSTDVIPYREITRADFRGTVPPPQVAEHASEFGAFTCANIVPVDEGVFFEVTPDPKGGRQRVRVQHAEFRAEMDRACSWWNPNPQSPLPEAYVLEHEQIHFALTEIHARKLSVSIRDLEFEIDAGGGQAEVQAAIERYMQRAGDALIEENTRFDHDTSGRYEPGRQARWRADVEARLAANAPR
jgi:hypothetical protein